jgi:hypothetical protein
MLHPKSLRRHHPRCNDLFDSAKGIDEESGSLSETAKDDRETIVAKRALAIPASAGAFPLKCSIP